MKNETKWEKCRTCKGYTTNKSRVCDDCLEKKYGLLGERRYDSEDTRGEEALIPLDVVLKALDKFEVDVMTGKR